MSIPSAGPGAGLRLACLGGSIRRPTTIVSKTWMVRINSKWLIVALCSDLQEATETWMLLEFADRGSLDKAIETRRFYRRGVPTLDLVSLCSAPRLIPRACLCVDCSVRHLPNFCNYD